MVAEVSVIAVAVTALISGVPEVVKVASGEVVVPPAAFAVTIAKWYVLPAASPVSGTEW